MAAGNGAAGDDGAAGDGAAGEGAAGDDGAVEMGHWTAICIMADQEAECQEVVRERILPGTHPQRPISFRYSSPFKVSRNSPNSTKMVQFSKHAIFKT